MLYPFTFLIWNLLPKQISYSAKLFKTALKSLLIIIFVMFDVIDSWLSSIIFKNLLYLNLAPNLFNSVESAYALIFEKIILLTKLEDGARFVL